MKRLKLKLHLASKFFSASQLCKVGVFTVFGLASFLAVSASAAYAENYYVSPTGSDTNVGTVEAPFQSLMKAQSVASSGDTVYLRGGTYDTFTIAATDSNYNYVHRMDKSGITYEAYPGEKPVFDFSKVAPTKRVASFHIPVGVTDVTFRGIEVTGTKAGTQKQSENFRIQGIAHFDRVSIHDTEANGFYWTTYGGGSAINCDSYNNVGPTASSIGNTDGFGTHGTNPVTLKYCRSWNNSDDGYDSISCTGPVVYDHCWAYSMNEGADSNGFKVGGGTFGGKFPDPMPVHTVKYCLSAENASNGFYSNHQAAQSANWIHNTSYNNARSNYNMLERVGPNDLTDIPGTREVLHFNISFNGTDIMNANLPVQNETGNSWTRRGVTVSEEDFQSLDASQMTLPRKADGSLPDITFMRLVRGSDLSGLGNFWE